ncbi:MAG: transcription-repair coupling factor [SAR324 cluster bacterium]|nr:transcription-repair coupling factor [SAR324 cluster bacterium]
MNESLKSVSNRLLRPLNDLSLNGLRGSSKSLLIAHLKQLNEPPVMVLTESFEKAEQLRDDLAFFMEEGGIYFFPHWDTLPYDSFSPHRDIVAQRFETLRALCDRQVKVLITTPMALMQRMMPRALFEQNCFTLQTLKNYPRQDLLLQLENAGYTLVELVEERGEFKLGDEIIDLFPLNHKVPLRLEWDSERLLSIKKFDVESQLSEGNSLEFIDVLPAQEVLLTTETKDHALKMLEKEVSSVDDHLLSQTRGLIKQKRHFPGIESLLSLFYQSPAVLFDYWAPESLLVLDEPLKVKEKAQAVYNEIFAEFELSRQQENFALNPELSYLSHREIEISFKKYLTVNCTELPAGQTHFSTSYDCPFLDNRSLRSEGKKPHQDPHSSVARVIKKIIAWQQDGAAVVFCAKNQTHADHFKELLSDFAIEADCSTLKKRGIQNWSQWFSDGLIFPASSGNFASIPIITGALSSGFHIVNELGGVEFALLTEEEIFGVKARNRRLNQNKTQQFMGNLDDLKEGDYIVHLDYGIGQYQGLKKIDVSGQNSDFMVLSYARNEKVYVPVDKFHLIQKYINAEGTPPRLNKLGEKSWKKAKSKVAKAVEDMSAELVEIYAQRKSKKGFRFSPDDHMMREFELAFPYEETEDQLSVIKEVKEDMESLMPMDRLVCGDVGFGKTEIAIRAAFKAVGDSKQVCVLVPTTILAQQHFLSFSSRMDGMPVVVDVISRFRSAGEQKQILKRLAAGEIDILIGTHRVLSADVKFKDLGLLVVDEEQRFGVRHKEKIKKFRANIDVLTLSATPIPRTLHMSMMGIRDLSLIVSPPPDRLAVRTRFLKSSDHIIQEAVSREIRRNGQVFVVHNRVESIYPYATYLKTIMPEMRIAIGHGQLGEHELEKIMMDFISGEYDILVSTTIIESGLDIPRANTIILNNAHQFGLSQLYQLRGRVGRSNLQAYAYLLVPPEKILTNVAEERLNLLQELNDLGAGFKIASRDLELRGAGNLLGSEQSGHIASVGMELYTEMIEEAVKKLQQKQHDALRPEEIKINFEVVMNIPEEFIRSSSQRLSLYKKLAAVKDEESLWKLRDDTENRFGHLPDPLLNLFKSMQIRLLGQRFAFKSIQHRNSQLQVQIAQTEKLIPEKLVEWLQVPQTPLRFVPENTLMLNDVPNSMNDILDGLRSFEQLFVN